MLGTPLAPPACLTVCQLYAYPAFPSTLRRWLVAFARALKAQLTEDSYLRAELEVGSFTNVCPLASLLCMNTQLTEGSDLGAELEVYVQVAPLAADARTERSRGVGVCALGLGLVGQAGTRQPPTMLMFPHLSRSLRGNLIPTELDLLCTSYHSQPPLDLRLDLRHTAAPPQPYATAGHPHPHGARPAVRVLPAHLLCAERADRAGGGGPAARLAAHQVRFACCARCGCCARLNVQWAGHGSPCMGLHARVVGLLSGLRAEFEH